MNNPESTSSNSDADRDNGLGDGVLEATKNFSSSDFLDATGTFDSSTRDNSPEVTAAFDSTGRPHSSSANNLDRARSLTTGSLIGSVIGGYRIVAHLGQGGMGRVFRADDSSGRPVAIKLLSPDLSRSSEALARFKQEGLIASQINHARCVFVHRVDEDAGMPFIAMELMTGLTLKDLVIQKGPLPSSDALKLILQCIDGLIEAHSRGMIHRDIKPANCYLDSSGNVKIGDFGLARSLVGNSELTQTGAFIGTPLFASPEQLLGQVIDARSDIYSLTATLYFLLAGKAPFESPHAAQVIARIASSDPPPFSSVDVEVPEELERIVMKGLSRDASKRYQSFVEMQADLLCLLAPKPESASLGRRIIAGLADSFLMSVFIGLLTLFVLPTWIIQNSNLASNAFAAALLFVYFFVSEVVFATSLGKAALRIRVADSITGRRASVQKIFSRALVYSILSILFESAFYAVLYLTGWISSGVIQGMVSMFSVVLTYLALFSTWRFTKKRQLLHDWLSGTECLISVPPVVQITQLELPDFSPPAVPSRLPLCPELGRFKIIGEITAPGSDGSVRWLSAEDPQLDRSVWIAFSPEIDIDYEQLQCAKDPSTRLRFIEQGFTENGQRWFAYVAPEGIPLQECLASGVHFAWPVTSLVFRQMIAHFQSVASSGSRATVAKLSDWWVDRAGRVSIVSLAMPQNSGAVDYQARDQQNMANYQQLLQTVCLLALPRTHKLRRSFCKAKSTSARDCLPAREALPSLRSMKFCELVASARYTPVLKVLEQEVSRLNKGNHCVNSKARFLNAVLSLAFSVPVLFISAMLILLPGIIYLTDARKDLQCLATLEAIANSPEQKPSWWEGIAKEQQSLWTSDVGKRRLKELAASARTRLQKSFDNLGKIEQTIVSRLAFESNLLEPPIFDLGIVAAAGEIQPEKTRDVDVKFRGGGVIINEIDTPKWNREHFDYAMMLVQNDATSTVGFSADEFALVSLSVYLLIGLACWTWLTFGGMSTRVTGICFVARDGTRMGILRSGLRTLVVFLPVIILLLLVVYWPLQNANDVWWTTQIKRGLLISPVLYLASTLFWNNRTIADILSGTTAIPR